MGRRRATIDGGPRLAGALTAVTGLSHRITTTMRIHHLLPPASSESPRSTFRPGARRFNGYLLCLACLAVIGYGRAATVTLAWDPSPETNVAKYVLYQGTASGQYTRQIDVTNKVNGVLATTNSVPDLANSTTYYFVVTARSTTGLESPPSNEIAYTTPAAANVAPSITCPANISGLQAAGLTGAVVTYPAPTVSDPDSPTPTVTCVPASGSLFPLGTTTVRCTARDSSGSTSTCSFTVTVVDTRAPAITCPADLTGVTATSTNGAVVTYPTPTAVDLVDGSRPVTCSPASGSLFPIGTTTVTCTASDTRGNIATCRFAVTVVSAQMRASVVGRHVFYNNSAWDGKDLNANAADDAARAPDKTALLPGGTATFANYTSFNRGLNGIMVDIAGLPGTPTASDFGFRVGNDNNITNWAAGPAPSQVVVRQGAGVSGSARIHLRWADNAIQKQWLQITVRPTLGTGLSAADVFYFGNAIGETGDRATDAVVDDADALLVVYNPRGTGNPAPIDFRYDMDRNKLVDMADTLITRGNFTSASGRLLLISPSATAAPKLTDDPDDPPAPPDDPTLGQANAPGSSTVAAPRDLVIRPGEDGTLLIECVADRKHAWQLQSTDSLGHPLWKPARVTAEATADGTLHRWRVAADAGATDRFYRVALVSAADGHQ